MQRQKIKNVKMSRRQSTIRTNRRSAQIKRYDEQKKTSYFQIEQQNTEIARESAARSKGFLLLNWLHRIIAKGTRPDMTEATCYKLKRSNMYGSNVMLIYSHHRQSTIENKRDWLRYHITYHPTTKKFRIIFHVCTFHAGYVYCLITSVLWLVRRRCSVIFCIRLLKILRITERNKITDKPIQMLQFSTYWLFNSVYGLYTTTRTHSTSIDMRFC